MCYTPEILQQVIDNAYDGNEAEVMEHIKTCPACRKIYTELKESDSYVKNLLQQGMAQPSVPAFRTEKNIEKKVSLKGRFNNMSKKTKYIASAAAALVLCTGLLTVNPVRAAASDFLKLFRVQDVKAVSINADDLQKMSNLFQNGKGNVNISDMLKMKADSSGQEKAVNNPTAEAIKGLSKDAKLLKLPEGYNYRYASIEPKKDITIELNVKKANDFLGYLGEKSRFSENVGGKPFIIHTGNVLNYSITNGSKDDRSYINVIQMDTPSYEVPDGVDFKGFISTVVSMNIMPENLKNQLMGIGDLASTIPFPYDEQREVKQDINVNGQNAIFIHGKDANSKEFRICFKENNKLYIIDGFYPNDKVLQLINTME